jgi:hypothetical protein
MKSPGSADAIIINPLPILHHCDVTFYHCDVTLHRYDVTLHHNNGYMNYILYSGNFQGKKCYENF